MLVPPCCLFLTSPPSHYLLILLCSCRNEMLNFMIFGFHLPVITDLGMLIRLGFYILFQYDFFHLVGKIHGLLCHKFLLFFSWKYLFELKRILVWSLNIFLIKENAFSKYKTFVITTFLVSCHQMIQIVNANKLDGHI